MPEARGDTIYGRIEKQSPDTWLIDGAWQEENGRWRNTTLVSQAGGFNYNYADVTLEAYNLTSCAKMSKGSVTFSELPTYTERSVRVAPAHVVCDRAAHRLQRFDDNRAKQDHNGNHIVLKREIEGQHPQTGFTLQYRERL